jgi:hypothetical protein
MWKSNLIFQNQFLQSYSVRICPRCTGPTEATVIMDEDTSLLECNAALSKQFPTFRISQSLQLQGQPVQEEQLLYPKIKNYDPSSCHKSLAPKLSRILLRLSATLL